MPNYTKEQVEDIKARELKALAFLKDLQLTPSVSMQFVNMGDDNFGIKPIPFLQDFKYTPTSSPIQHDDLETSA